MSLTSAGKREFYGFIRKEASAVSGQLDLDDDAVERLKSRSAAFRQGLLTLVRRHATAELTEDTAREILGRNFFGSTECEKHFGAKLEEVPTIPYTADDLEAVKGTHVLVLVLPLSVNEIRAKHTELFLIKKNASYADGRFAIQKPDKAQWHLVRKTPGEGSTSKLDETPRARVVIYTIIAHFLNHGERLFEKICVRCCDLYASGGRIDVGDFDADGLRVHSHWDGYLYYPLGIASSRKSKTLTGS